MYYRVRPTAAQRIWVISSAGVLPDWLRLPAGRVGQTIATAMAAR